MLDIKQQVRDFYNQVGWKEVGEGVYQNARYEDLRPVSREYIHRCHLRVLRHLKPAGRFLLDAGSGPIQYPEYLEYSKGYVRRVCADISLVALQEARRRIGDHGLFVVADIANLPFKPGCFEGVVSLHTIHHLPVEEHERAYGELYRMLAPGSMAVVVNGWDSAPLQTLWKIMVKGAQRLYALKQRLAGKPALAKKTSKTGKIAQAAAGEDEPKGTFVRKHNAPWLKKKVGSHMPLRIWVWRSVSVHFMRTFVHQPWGGRGLLRLLFWLEDRLPHFLGENGQYPLIVIRKT
jgi:SAM-dependent methyltransferase